MKPYPTSEERPQNYTGSQKKTRENLLLTEEKDMKLHMKFKGETVLRLQ